MELDGQPLGIVGCWTPIENGCLSTNVAAVADHSRTPTTALLASRGTQAYCGEQRPSTRGEVWSWSDRMIQVFIRG